jgi:ketosteroid isomerase-like protein
VFDKDLDRLLALLDPAVEWVSQSDAIEPGIRHGHQGVRDAFAATAMAWDEPTHTAEDFLNADDRVLVASVHSPTLGSLRGRMFRARSSAVAKREERQPF